MRVDIYSKPNCSLCDEAIAVVEETRARIPFDLRIISILEDPAAFEAWRYDIPVVVIDGTPAFKHRVDPVDLETRLKEARAGTAVANPPARDG